MKDLYFDNSATTQVDEDIARIAFQVMVQNYGNPSSPYYLGREALNLLTKARHQIAMTIGAPTRDIYFTSGGTESNNLAILGTAERFQTGRIVTTAIEHDSVLEPIRRLGRAGFATVFVSPREGRIHGEDVVKAVDSNTVLVSVMAVNNETGEILPLKEIIQGVRQKNPNTVIHCDCVQAFGKMPFGRHEYDVDLLSVSAHKIHGPKGVGALYVKEGIPLVPRRFGGGQESRLRPGTEPLPLIAAFGQAAENAVRGMEANHSHVKELRKRLTDRLSLQTGIVINSPECCLDYILNISMLGKKTDWMLERFRQHGIFVSGSSACSMGAVSHVIRAMELGEERLESTIRIGFSKKNTLEEVDFLAEVIGQAVKE